MHTRSSKRVLEIIYPVGPWLTHPVTATVACTPEEVASLPGLVWHGALMWWGGQYGAHLEGRDVETVNAIMALDAS